jgi:regulator of cell morphogenesis and NO signaling
MSADKEILVTTINTLQTVGELVTEHPPRSRVFERHGIDYCCGGKIPLEQACQQSGVEIDTVLKELGHIESLTDTSKSTDWSQASMTELADHIEQTHHAYLREELPRLTGLVGKIREVHGERHPKLVEVQRVFLGLRDELMMHMMKEEQVLFPMIRQMEASDNEPSFDCGSVDNPIRVMEHEHDNAGNALARLNELTGGYLPPADACNTYRATLSGLQELELDLHLHIHKENNILFPRASEREKLLCGG